MTEPTNPRLIHFAEALPPAQKYNLHLMVSASLEMLANRLEPGKPPSAAWTTAVRVLARFGKQGAERMGLLPPIQVVLPELRREARAMEPTATRLAASSTKPGGEVARELARSRALRRIIESHVKEDLRPLGECHYHFYFRTGDHVAPHVDSAQTSYLNCVIVVDHDAGRDGRRHSALNTYDERGGRTRVPLDKGEAAALYATATVHARSPVWEGEKVTILSIGFGPR